MIEARVNAVLRKNGLKPFDAMSKPTAPFYCVQVSVVGIFSAINASFGRRVTFNDGIRESNTLADTWKRGIRGSADIGADPSKIVDSSLDEVSKLTEVFANEFLKANRKSSTPQTENSVGGQHQASEETKADAPATQSPKANEEAEEIEEMNDWHGVSPGKALFAVTRFIPDPVYMQRHDHDGVAVGIFRGEFQTPAIVARHNFRGLFIAHIEWSPDSKFLLFTTANNGLSPWHAAAFVFCAADKSFRYVDAAIGDVVSPKFHFEPPNIASMEVKKGEAEEDVKVSLSKAMQQMPRVK